MNICENIKQFFNDLIKIKNKNNIIFIKVNKYVNGWIKIINLTEHIKNEKISSTYTDDILNNLKHKFNTIFIFENDNENKNGIEYPNTTFTNYYKIEEELKKYKLCKNCVYVNDKLYETGSIHNNIIYCIISKEHLITQILQQWLYLQQE